MDGMDYEELLELQERIGAATDERAAAAAALESTTTFEVSEADAAARRAAGGDAARCVVCMEDIAVGDVLRRMARCPPVPRAVPERWLATLKCPVCGARSNERRGTASRGVDAHEPEVPCPRGHGLNERLDSGAARAALEPGPDSDGRRLDAASYQKCGSRTPMHACRASVCRFASGARSVTRTIESGTTTSSADCGVSSGASGSSLAPGVYERRRTKHVADALRRVAPARARRRRPGRLLLGEGFRVAPLFRVKEAARGSPRPARRAPPDQPGGSASAPSRKDQFRRPHGEHGVPVVATLIVDSEPPRASPRKLVSPVSEILFRRQGPHALPSGTAGPYTLGRRL